ncbi:LysR family transcriptional regulator [Streptomyces sp. NPDC001970]
MTQPALPSGVARLEGKLGVKLFDRSPRGVRPTEHGARILPLIERVLGACRRGPAAGRSGHRNDPHGCAPLIAAELVARAFDAARTLKRPRDLVLREADFDPLRRMGPRAMPVAP